MPSSQADGGPLREEELQLIYEAREALLKNLDKPMPLQILSKLVGLNRNKLKIGFQQLYDCTVTAFRLHARMGGEAAFANDGNVSLSYAVKWNDAIKPVGHGAHRQRPCLC